MIRSSENCGSYQLPASSASTSSDAAAACHVYDLLEKQIVPAYYEHNAQGLPRRWIGVMKHAMRAAGAGFTARRMLIDYVKGYYVPSITGDDPPDDPPAA